MTPGRTARAAGMAVLLAAAGVCAAGVLSVAALQRLLQEAPQRELRFQETRESPWLSAPIETRGTMKSDAGVLEKKVETPRRETWRILDDRIALVGPGSAPAKEVLFSDSPAVAALARAWRHVMAGDLRALDKDFSLAPGGEERLWTLVLVPRRPDIGRFLKQIELQGTGARLQAIVILEPNGERTTTRLTHEP